MKVIILMFFILFNTSFGAGVSSHRNMSKKALEYMKQTDLRDMLKRNFKYFMGTSMLPDMGYIIRVTNNEAGWWGEETHWGEFFNWYYGYIGNLCLTKGLPPKNSPQCEYLWTLFFGALSHGFGDIQWHGGYIFRFSIMEYGAGLRSSHYSTAHSMADNLGDLPVIFLNMEKGLQGNLHFNWTAQVINAFADFKKKPRVSENNLMMTLALQEAWYNSLVNFGWPVYWYFKLKFRWGNDNHNGTLGGIDNTARRIAEIFDLIWYDVRGWNYSRFPRITTDGSWPFNNFKITKGDGSQTLNRAYHEQNYQLSPPGTYDCRYGLYLGGWRWSSFGAEPRCPYKATADYQKSRCNYWRFWPLKCKIY